MVGHFGWLSASEIPTEYDLRRCGWRLIADLREARAESRCPLLADKAAVDAPGWVELLGARGQNYRDKVLLIGVSDGFERARLLRLGFGDVVSAETRLAEIDARAERVAAQAEALPRHRDLGPLRLDLFARDGFAGARRLGLHPREFALLWRLADTPGLPVGKRDLVSDVWRLGHMPETNSVAVHISRLRGKLARAGLAELVQTAPAGGYVLARSGSPARPASPTARDGNAQLVNMV